jgi:hypothetical protein
MNSIVLMILVASLLLTAAGYAQVEIPHHTAGSRKVLLTRVLLIAVGVAFGYISAAAYSSDPLVAVLVFLIAFGMVHAPAALILLFKHWQGAGRS